MDAAPDYGVVVDIVSEDGVLYLELANLTDHPALNVVCTFEPKLVDLEGRDVSELALFRRLPFLAPGRRIRTILDSSAGYFAREKAGNVTVAVEYEHAGEGRRSGRVVHDLEVFRQLTYRA